MTHWHTRSCAAVILVAVIVVPAGAEGPVYWHNNFPKSGVRPGSIDVAGKVQLKPGWSLLNRVVLIRASKEAGGTVETSPGPLRMSPDGIDWRGTVAGLEPTEKYSVTIEVLATDGTEVQRFESEAKVTAAR